MERLIAATTLLALVTVTPASAQTLRGSRASVEKQHRVALEHDYSFLSSSGQVRRFANNGLLVSVPGNANYELSGVSFPFARPAVKTFIERLSRQYRNACGEPLVVTSLTRPTTRQPRNASDQSVHPAGMAVDMRISRSSKCRRWLERVLLDLERKGVLEATHERYPAHYHVAVFPNPYLVYIGYRRAPATAAPRKATVQPAEPQKKAEEPAKETAEKADAETALETASTVTAGDVEVESRDREVDEDASTASAAASSTVGDAAGAANAGTAAARADSTGAATTRGDSTAVAGREPIVVRVNRGDTLWEIARRHGTSVAELKALNRLRGDGLKPGQRLIVRARTD